MAPISKLIKKAGSLKYTIFLLLSLAVVSGIGTFIPQGEDPAFYVHNYGRTGAVLIRFFQADRFYQGFIFYMLLFLLALNLLACVLNSLKPKIFQDKRKRALFLVHLSILFVFTGSVLSRFARFSEYQKVRPGEKITFVRGLPGIEFRRFEIKYYPHSDRVRLYRSIVRIPAGEKGGESRVIEVNHPLSYKGFVIYQDGFEPFARMHLTNRHAGRLIWQGLAVQGQRINIDKRKGLYVKVADFIPDARVVGHKIMLISYRLKDAAILVRIYKKDSLVTERWISNNKRLNAIFRPDSVVFDFKITDLRTEFATIVHVLKDPGVKVVWGGFICLFVGIVLFLINKTF